MQSREQQVQFIEQLLGDIGALLESDVAVPGAVLARSLHPSSGGKWHRHTKFSRGRR